MKGSNFSAYVSQKNWKDSDKQVECTVECDIDKQRYLVKKEREEITHQHLKSK